MAPWRMFRRIKLSVIRIKGRFSLCWKTLIGTLTQSRYQALRLIKYGRQKRGHHFQIYLVNIKKINRVQSHKDEPRAGTPGKQRAPCHSSCCTIKIFLCSKVHKRRAKALQSFIGLSKFSIKMKYSPYIHSINYSIL